MMIKPNRRAFLAGSSLASIGLLAGCAPSGKIDDAATSAASYTDMLGVQLYTVRSLFETDPQATLAALAEIGFKDLETAGLFDHKASDIKLMMDDLGLVSRSSHVRLPWLREDMGKVIEDATALGQSKLYLGWIPDEERTPDRYRALADLLNSTGEQAKAAGMMMGYHNHEFEFIEQDGTTGYDILLERTDPELVTMELDFFWAAEAGKDPLEIFKSAPGRFSSVHIKDRTTSGEMVAVGDGAIDFKTLLPLAQEAGVERFYVEHDEPEDPLVSVGRSYTYLTS